MVVSLTEKLYGGSSLSSMGQIKTRPVSSVAITCRVEARSDNVEVIMPNSMIGLKSFFY